MCRSIVPGWRWNLRRISGAHRVLFAASATCRAKTVKVPFRKAETAPCRAADAGGGPSPTTGTQAEASEQPLRRQGSRRGTTSSHDSGPPGRPKLRTPESPPSSEGELLGDLGEEVDKPSRWSSRRPVSSSVPLGRLASLLDSSDVRLPLPQERLSRPSAPSSTDVAVQGTTEGLDIRAPARHGKNRVETPAPVSLTEEELELAAYVLGVRVFGDDMEGPELTGCRGRQPGHARSPEGLRVRAHQCHDCHGEAAARRRAQDLGEPGLSGGGLAPAR